MSDCQAEQQSEVEALQSIYSEELEILETEPFYKFTISLKSQETNDTEREQDSVSCMLTFTYTKNYPNEVPVMEVESQDLLEDRLGELTELMSQQAAENIGMIMVFTIAAAVLDKLNQYFEDNTKERKDAAEQCLREAEESERKKFEGTRCTVENFMAWKLRFDAEREEEKKKLRSKDENASKPTGYELFMRDKTLDESDLQFLESDDLGTVDVDESLFADVDDLELGETEED